MQAPDPQAKLRELLSRPLVKVCGLTRQDDVDAAVEAGADLLGFILVDKSPRRAAAVLDVPDTVLSVAVFVEDTTETRADLVQFYPDDGGTVRGREALLLRDGRRSRGCSTSRGSSSDPAHWSAAAAANGRVVLAGGSAPTTCATRSPPFARGGSTRRRRSSVEPGVKDHERCARTSRRHAMSDGIFGAYGGRYVPETLIPALDELEQAWRDGARRRRVPRGAASLATTYAGRPTPLTLAERFAPGKRIYLKREDLLHTGAHKVNNALGQAVLARRLGKTRIVAETGAGQHGVATATVCARFGYECVVYMGEEDMRRQKPNVERMKLLGAEVRSVDFGTKTLKEATSEAIRDWITNVETTHYLIGSCVGPAPYPELVAELQSVIGREAREQMLAVEGRLPEAVVACVGGGSNAIGIFHGFVDDEDVRLIGVEAAGAASLGAGRPGVLHGARSSILADEDGQIADAHSISAGLDYPGVGPEHAFLRDTRPRGVRRRHRRRGARRVRRPRAHRGDHPGARAGARARARPRARRGGDPGRPLRPRRQGSRRGPAPPRRRWLTPRGASRVGPGARRHVLRRLGHAGVVAVRGRPDTVCEPRDAYPPARAVRPRRRPRPRRRRRAGPLLDRARSPRRRDRRVLSRPAGSSSCTVSI